MIGVVENSITGNVYFNIRTEDFPFTNRGDIIHYSPSPDTETLNLQVIETVVMVKGRTQYSMCTVKVQEID